MAAEAVSFPDPPSSQSLHFGSHSHDGLESLCDSDDEIDGLGFVTDFDRPPFCWDYLGFNSPTNNTHVLGFEQPCLNQESCDIELSSSVSAGVDDDDDYGVDLVFSQCCHGYNDYEEYDDEVDIDTPPIQLESDDGVIEVQEISDLFDMYQERREQEMMTMTHSDDTIQEEVEEYGVLGEAIRNLESEIMLAFHNFRREMQDLDFNEDDAAYEAIIREMEDRMNEWRGSPPTAKSVIDSLPTVCLSAESLEGNGACCAICKDDVSGEDTLRQLPCLHYYHGDCIVPWLEMHNTCPLCRHQLPTEYDTIKRQEGEDFTIDGDVSAGVPPGYGFNTFL